MASYILKKEILKTDVLLREAQKEAFGVTSGEANIFKCKRPKLTSTTTTTKQEEPRSSGEKIYFEITEFPDDAGVMLEDDETYEKVDEMNGVCLEESNMEIKTEPDLEI